MENEIVMCAIPSLSQSYKLRFCYDDDYYDETETDKLFDYDSYFPDPYYSSRYISYQEI